MQLTMELIFRLYIIGVIIVNILNIPMYVECFLEFNILQIFLGIIASMLSWFVIPFILESLYKIFRLKLKMLVLEVIDDITKQNEEGGKC